MEETARYKANAGIKIISDKEADKIIETREPRGLFVYAENGLIVRDDNRTEILCEAGAKIIGLIVRCDNRTEILCEVGAKIIGIDNRTGDAWTEEFDTYEDCVAWLLDPNREAQEAQEEAEPMHYNYPRIEFVEGNTAFEQLRHVESELQEIKDAFGDEKFIEEIVDLHHSVETLIRILMEQEGVDIEKYRRAVIEKNRKRGYYDTDTTADTAAEAMARVAEHDGTADKMARGE